MSKKTKKKTDAQLINTMFSSILAAKRAHERLNKQNPELALYAALSIAESEFARLSHIIATSATMRLTKWMKAVATKPMNSNQTN